MNYTYYNYSIVMCWITMLTPLYQDSIIAALVKRGYVVGSPASADKICLSAKDRMGAILSLSISKNGANVDSDLFYQELISVLKECKVFYYSVVICGTDGKYLWVGSNIELHYSDNSIDVLIDNPKVPKKDLN